MLTVLGSEAEVEVVVEVGHREWIESARVCGEEVEGVVKCCGWIGGRCCGWMGGRC